MSWQAINDILGKALLDQRFAEMLLMNPVRAVREGDFDLTAEELDVLLKIKAESIVDLSAKLLIQLENNSNRR